MERQKFEDSWKQAFEKAELNPSEDVWTNIELDLEKAEGHQMRRKLLFYKMVAAASVIFAVAMGAAGIYLGNRQNNQLALSSTQNEQVQKPKSTQEAAALSPLNSGTHQPEETEIRENKSSD